MNPNLISWNLLWKDYRQARPALVGVLAILSAIQLLYLCLQLTSRGTGMEMYQPTYMLALISPTLVAMACSGLLIGHERQTRTWNWSSSLPIPWPSALFSKTVVWLLSSVVMCALLLLLYAALYRFAESMGRSGHWSIDRPDSETRLFALMMVVVPIEVFIAFSIATLLWNDTLFALVVAGIVVALGHVLLIEFIPRWTLALSGGELTSSELVGPVGAGLVIVTSILSCIALCALFRWRWTTGLMDSVSLPIHRLIPLRLMTSSSVGMDSRRGKPSEYGMLLSHASCSAVGLRLSVVCGALLAILLFDRYMEQWTVPNFSALLLGISAFSSDQTARRFRFFADRGSNWKKMLLTHTSVPLALLVLIMLVAVLADTAHGRRHAFQPSEIMGQINVIVGILFVSVFCSLCVSNAIMALVLAAATFVMAFVSFAAVDSFWLTWFGESSSILLYQPLSLAILLIAIAIQMRRWLIEERHRSLRLYLQTLVAAVGLPILLCFSLAFWRVPVVPWQGVPTHSASIQSQTKLPLISLAGFDEPVLQLSINPTTSMTQAAKRAYAVTHSEIEADGSQWLVTWQSSIDQLNQMLNDHDKFVSPDHRTLQLYQRAVESSAVIATYATKTKNARLACAAWKANRDLLELSRHDGPLAFDSLTARIKSWALLSTLEVDDWIYLRAECDVEQLLPEPVQNEIWISAVRNQASAFRHHLLDPYVPLQKFLHVGLQRFLNPLDLALRYFPPLRWYAERRMALTLAATLAQLRGEPLPYGEVNQGFMGFRIVAEPLLELQQLERQVPALSKQ